MAKTHRLDPTPETVHWGYFDAQLPPRLEVESGDTVVVERPTYDRTLLNLRQQGGDVQAVTIQSDGIDTDELGKLLESGIRPKLAHIIPNYQNPAGVTLSLEKRQRLLALAAEYGFTIFEDDPYADIRFRGEPLPSMLTLDDRGSVVHASSFTKTVCPGVRVGYLVGPAPLIADIAKRATNLYISPGMVAQSIVHQFCVSGEIDRSIHTVREALGEIASAAAGFRLAAGEARTICDLGSRGTLHWSADDTMTFAAGNELFTDIATLPMVGPAAAEDFYLVTTGNTGATATSTSPPPASSTRRSP